MPELCPPRPRRLRRDSRRIGADPRRLSNLGEVQDPLELVVPAESRIEIAYFIFPHAEGLGHGKAMAAGLLAIAAACPDVHTVIACTLPEENASAAILRGLRFTNTGTVVDPDDGTVWRWELRGRPR